MQAHNPYQFLGLFRQRFQPWINRHTRPTRKNLFSTEGNQGNKDSKTSFTWLVLLIFLLAPARACSVFNHGWTPMDTDYCRINKPTPAESSARAFSHWMFDVECSMFSTLAWYLVFPNPEHLPPCPAQSPVHQPDAVS